MSLTVTNYLSQIDRDFPVRSQDNDAQGFRNNWQNIYDAVSTLNNDLDFLTNSTIKISSTSTFNGNTLEDINFKNESLEIHILDLQTESIEIDYSKGNYQKVIVSAGTHDLTVINWPKENKSGKLILSISASCDKFSAINFNSSYINLSSQPNPFELDFARPNIFELTNEDSGTVYIRYLTNYTYELSSSTNILWANRLKIGKINNDIETNTFYTGTNKATIVQRGNQFGELALVPNRIKKSILDAIDKTSTTPIEIVLGDATDIVPGAFLYVSNLETKFTVIKVTTSSVFIEPGNFNINLLVPGDFLTFTNPIFNAQSGLLTLTAISTSSAFGSKSNFIGSVYADKNSLQVTFDNYGENNTNTFVFNKVDDSTDISIAGEEAVTANFIHNLLPIGSVIMWYGSSVDVPYGWTLCDSKGSVQTIINGGPGPVMPVPDLRNRFIVGGYQDVSAEPVSNIAGTFATVGGTADSGVIKHWHSATFFNGEVTPHTHKIIDPGHNHNNIDEETGAVFSALLLPRSQGALSGKERNDGADPNFRGSEPLLSSTTGIEILESTAGTPSGDVIVDNAGESNGLGANIPPFTALYYIMKIAGNT